MSQKNKNDNTANNQFMFAPELQIEILTKVRKKARKYFEESVVSQDEASADEILKEINET